MDIQCLLNEDCNLHISPFGTDVQFDFQHILKNFETRIKTFQKSSHSCQVYKVTAISKFQTTSGFARLHQRRVKKDGTILKILLADATDKSTIKILYFGRTRLTLKKIIMSDNDLLKQILRLMLRKILFYNLKKG